MMNDTKTSVSIKPRLISAHKHHRVSYWEVASEAGDEAPASSYKDASGLWQEHATIFFHNKRN